MVPILGSARDDGRVAANGAQFPRVTPTRKLRRQQGQVRVGLGAIEFTTANLIFGPGRWGMAVVWMNSKVASCRGYRCGRLKVGHMVPQEMS
jgi:hypothetical protein